ncbi:MAG: MATE family efflux transporter [Eubacteriales bacterium]
MKSLDLGSPKVAATVMKLAFPAMLAQFVNVLYSIVDRMFVGNIPAIGDTALAGLGVCAPMATFISAFAFLIGIGGAPLFAMSLGEGDGEKAKKILSNALLALVLVAVSVSAVIFAAMDPILRVFGASDKTFPYAKQYLTIYTAGALFSITAVGLNQFIIAQGYSGIGMCTTVIGALANVGLDPLFIYTFGMGVAGAALATILSQFLSFAFVFVFLLLKNTKIRLSFGGYSAKVIGKMFRLGLSPFLIIATDSIIIIISNMMLKTYGGAEADMWITVSTVVQAFLSVITMPLLGISTGTQPVLSYNYGARNIPLIKKAEKVIVLMGLAFTALMFGLSSAGRPLRTTANEDIVSGRVGDTYLHDRHHTAFPAICIRGRHDRARPAEVCRYAVHDEKNGRLLRFNRLSAHILGRGGGFLRRTDSGHLRRAAEQHCVRDILSENSKKEGGWAA